MTKVLTSEQEKIKASGRYVGIFPFEFDDSAEIPTSIQLIPIGAWDHAVYGPIVINGSAIQQFVRNFDAKIRKGVFITAGHEGSLELPAQGWITRVYARDTGLWGDVEWNKLGEDSLKDKQYKFFSPEFYLEYADPETHEVYQNVLTGGALTKSPYFKELLAVVFSDKNINSLNEHMDIKSILKKKAADRSDEEKDFLKKNASAMDTEDKKQCDDEAAEEADAKKKASEKKEADDKKALEDSNEAKGLNRDGSKKVVADDKGMVQISAAEYAILSGKADKGAEALQKLEASELTASVTALVMSETNSKGRFLPKDEPTLKTFMEKLNAEQRKAFADLIGQLPEAKLFREVGDNGGKGAGTVVAEVEAKIATIQASDKKVSYTEALKKVFSETKGLQDRYDAELQGKK